VAVLIPLLGELKVTVGGVELYPLPLDTISVAITEPSFTSATAVAGIPQSVAGELIVTSAFPVYPVPPELTVILPTV
jgi:hypothetical protein